MSTYLQGHPSLFFHNCLFLQVQPTKNVQLDLKCKKMIKMQCLAKVILQGSQLQFSFLNQKEKKNTIFSYKLATHNHIKTSFLYLLRVTNLEKEANHEYKDQVWNYLRVQHKYFEHLSSNTTYFVFCFVRLKGKSVNCFKIFLYLYLFWCLPVTSLPKRGVLNL